MTEFFKSIEGLTPQELLDIKYAVWLMRGFSEKQGITSCPWHDLYDHLKETPSGLHDDDDEFIKAHTSRANKKIPLTSKRD